MIFDVAGPFKVSRHGPKNIITDQSLDDLNTEVEKSDNGLSESCGCYVFAIRAGRGYTPYYVGQACKSSLPHESLNVANREKYNKVISQTKGTLVVFFLPLKTPTGKYHRKSNARLSSINFLERWLIATSIGKNPDLINNKETRFLRNIHVTGIFNPTQGEATTASQHLSKALW